VNSDLVPSCIPLEQYICTQSTAFLLEVLCFYAVHDEGKGLLKYGYEWLSLTVQYLDRLMLYIATAHLK
jgi:hypothetical protein